MQRIILLLCLPLILLSACYAKEKYYLQIENALQEEICIYDNF